LLVCYESHLTNDQFGFKLATPYKITPGKDDRFCLGCVNLGICQKRNSKGQLLQWNGIKIFFNVDT